MASLRRSSFPFKVLQNRRRPESGCLWPPSGAQTKRDQFLLIFLAYAKTAQNRACLEQPVLGRKSTVHVESCRDAIFCTGRQSRSTQLSPMQPPPSARGACCLIRCLIELGILSTTADDAIIQRIAFLQAQVSPVNKPEINATFQHQIDILQSIDLEKLQRSILMRKAHLSQSKDIRETDRLFSELEALEWVQRQVNRKHGTY